MTALSDLIARLEEAERGSRDFDGLIFIAVSPGLVAAKIDRIGGVVGWHPRTGPYQSAREVPHYTTRLDAALTLVPEGWGTTITIPKNRTGHAEVWHASSGERYSQNGWQQDARGNRREFTESIFVLKHAPSPALAVVIAALKSRQALSSTGDA